ncbi:MAG: GGDEF domain-containing protein, partial [Gammaproteobacteria bacterium]
RIHPHPKVYHYDVVVKFTIGNKHYLFLVSFAPDEIANIIKLASSESHQLVLVQKNASDLIEVTPQGSRVNISDRLDFRMTPQELDRVLAEKWVPGTRWHVYDLHSEKLFETYSSNIEKRSLWIYICVVLIVVIFAIMLLIQVCKNKKVADDLLEKNKEIEDLNARLRSRNVELSEQAITDGLTNLYNRRYFDMQVSHEWNRSQRLCLPINIAFIDIDYFKQYNDLYGHQMGDVCLKVVADMIADNFKRSNEFVARYGGEEFVVVNIGTKPEFFKICMQEVKDRLAERKIAHSGSDISSYLTISVGIASAKDANRTTYTELISVADAALYDAKKQGRDCIVHKQAE